MMLSSLGDIHLTSHQNALSAASDEGAREIRRNDEVDMLAKEALQFHDDEEWEW